MGCSRELLVQVREEIVAILRETHCFTAQDIANRYPFAPRVLRRLIWEATETLRLEDGIVFGPVRGCPGTFERKEWDQIERRAQRQRRRGTRAHRRAEQSLRIAANAAPDAAKERLNDAADREALRLAMRAART